MGVILFPSIVTMPTSSSRGGWQGFVEIVRRWYGRIGLNVAVGTMGTIQLLENSILLDGLDSKIILSCLCYMEGAKYLMVFIK